jgi:hypothetical protein
MRRRIVAALLVTAVLMGGRPVAAAEHANEGTYWSDLGYGSAAILCNMLYMPVKLTYGLLGVFGGGLGYVLTAGDFDTADKIWSISMGGTYVMTPDMLRGEDEILFNGATPDPK